jgi:glycine/D-amino acid oxidase-like deaminating enzyme
MALSAEFAEWLERPRRKRLLGLPAPDGGWLFPQGGWARPGSVCDAMLAACGAPEAPLRRRQRAARTPSASNGRCARKTARSSRARAAPVVWPTAPARCSCRKRAAAAGALRGQVTTCRPGTLPQLPLVLCREAYLTPAVGGISAGATYDLDRRSACAPPASGKPGSACAACCPTRRRRRARRCGPRGLPLHGAGPPAAGRARCRISMRRQHRTPARRAAPPGPVCLLGYASRGLIWAPLAAELLAAQLETNRCRWKRAWSTRSIRPASCCARAAIRAMQHTAEVNFAVRKCKRYNWLTANFKAITDMDEATGDTKLARAVPVPGVDRARHEEFDQRPVRHAGAPAGTTPRRRPVPPIRRWRRCCTRRGA